MNKHLDNIMLNENGGYIGRKTQDSYQHMIFRGRFTVKKTLHLHDAILCECTFKHI